MKRCRSSDECTRLQNAVSAPPRCADLAHSADQRAEQHCREQIHEWSIEKSAVGERELREVGALLMDHGVCNAAELRCLVLFAPHAPTGAPSHVMTAAGHCLRAQESHHALLSRTAILLFSERRCTRRICRLTPSRCSIRISEGSAGMAGEAAVQGVGVYAPVSCGETEDERRAKVQRTAVQAGEPVLRGAGAGRAVTDGCRVSKRLGGGGEAAVGASAQVRGGRAQRARAVRAHQSAGGRRRCSTPFCVRSSARRRP